MAKTKALISCATTVQLICVFVFAYANCWFSLAQAHIIHVNLWVCGTNINLMQEVKYVDSKFRNIYSLKMVTILSIISHFCKLDFGLMFWLKH